MSTMTWLQEIRAHSGTPRTTGLPDDVVTRFAAKDPKLGAAVELAIERHRQLRETHGALLAMDEADLIGKLQQGYVNFYQPATVNPYVALAAKGPWVISSHGAVIHDSGGYGMLGQGHNPDVVLQALARPQVMANVMTASFSQLAFDERLRRELGHTRPEGCPFDRFICLNSGSEAVTMASRLADINARTMTAPGARHAGRRIKALAIEGGFHGRTCRPARISDSCRDAYEKHLASFLDHSDLVVVPQNDLAALELAFTQAEEQGWFYEALYMEPVQGEGAPGHAITRAFYDLAARRIHDMGGLLVIDSIQAGLRAHGVLSVVDYPGFQDAVVPDVETWSKALNAGQYPMSVLGLSERGSSVYVSGVYGNTMTTNPRALDVAVAVLDGVTPALRENICARGDEFIRKLRALAQDFPGMVAGVQGTGLLFCVELNANTPVVGFGGPEERCRRAGMGVIHGGKNALRFTPHFAIDSDEIDLMVGVLRAVLTEIQAVQAA